jgi:hypothetical protein
MQKSKNDTGLETFEECSIEFSIWFGCSEIGRG